MTNSVVIFSGGQDSTTCLYWVKQYFPGNILALTFNYGQRHKLELESAKKIAKMAGVKHEIVDVGPLLVGSSPLVNNKMKLGQYASAKELPGGIEPTFVPGRNALFLVLAANRAMAMDAQMLVTGVSQADYGGYPDCREQFITSMSATLGHAMVGKASHFGIHTPLMNLSKLETVKLAKTLPGCWEALAYSHTCYDGGPVSCLKCHACIIRARGFHEAGEGDPLIVRLKQEGKLPKDTPDHGLLEVQAPPQQEDGN